MSEEQNNKPTEEVTTGQAGDNPVESSNPEVTTSSNSSTPIIIMVVVVLFLLVVGGIAGLFLLNSDDDSDSEPAETIADANSGLREAEVLAKSTATEFLRSINFDAIEEGATAEDVINIRSLEARLADLGDQSKYLGFPSIEVSGNTVHAALDGEFSSEGSTEGEFNFYLDIYVEYPENYDQTGLDSIEDLSEYLEGLDVQEVREILPAVQVVGNFEFIDPTNNVRGDFNVSFQDLVGYLTIDELDIEGLSSEERESLNLFTESTLSVNFEEFINQVIQEAATSVNDAVNQQLDLGIDLDVLSQTQETENVEEEFYMAIDEILAELSDEDRELLTDLGPDVISIFDNAINDLEIVTNVNKVDPIRNNSDYQCRVGDLNLNGILDTTESSIIELIELLDNDERVPNDNGEFAEETIEELRMSFDEARDGLDELGLQIEITLCSNVEDNYGVGGGFAVRATDGSDLLEMAYQFLIVDYDSSFTIEVPEDAIDFTNEFNTLLEEQMISNSNPIGPDSNSPTQGQNEDFPNEIPGPDFGGDDFDKYLNEIEEINRQLEEGEITIDEYVLRVEELEAKYNF